jgi:phosphoenolpyruvate carboxykinase (ATP)
MSSQFDLSQHGINVSTILRNAVPSRLYEEALRREKGSVITAKGALVAMSGEKTGRSPTDKRVVRDAGTQDDIWWGDINMPIEAETFNINKGKALSFLNGCDQLYCVDGYAGWDPKYRIKVRIICARAYHALFMHNMLIRPTSEELTEFGDPDYIVFNAGQAAADPNTPGLSSSTSVALSFEQKEFVILGTEYAGEMKKGVFTIMNYLMPKQNVLSMHCSATKGADGDTSVLFGLSGTGKTTLSADPKRKLIGDDEHCWTDEGLFNIEGGCYAKMIDLSAENEPDIWAAIQFGSVQENVVYDPKTRIVDYEDVSITNNTRGSYPIEYIENTAIPCVGGNPSNVIFLTCDAFGVLPPVSKLTPEQAMYHFISGYTAKVAGTEMGVDEPEATFSPCFGGPFLVWHPTKYAELLASKVRKHNVNCWLVNTGWSGGAYGTGKRMKLKYTRAIVDAIHNGTLVGTPTLTDPTFGLAVPTSCDGVPSEILLPRNTWSDKNAFDATAKKLAKLFVENFSAYADAASDAILSASPKP